MDTMIIGIAGGTGSGKTTLTEKLKAEFGEDVSVLYHDNYYRSHSAMPYEERAKLNYDHPDAFETDLLIRDIQALRRGETVRCPVYDYTIHDRSGETMEVRPTKVIIVEGIKADRVALRWALGTRACYVGMIGSRSKCRLIHEALLDEGVPPEQLDRVHAPIGLPIGGRTPGEIAVSIAAQLVQERTRLTREREEAAGT